MTLNANTAIIFTHIPKCAGTSFRNSLIVPNIEEEMMYRPSGGISKLIKHKKDFRYIIGHLPFNAEKYIHLSNPARKRKTITMVFLREPIDQMISFFYYQKQLGKYSAYLKDEEADIVHFYKTTASAQNIQTRFCSGIGLDLFFNKILKNPPNKLQLSRAKKNINSKINFVGQFENIGKEMQYISEKYKLIYQPTYSKTTKTKNRPSVDALKKEVKEELSKINNLDIELYQFAKEKIWANRVK